MSITSPGAERLSSLQPAVGSSRARVSVVAGPHAAAFIILCFGEREPFHVGLFLLAWGLANFAWLFVFRRPGVAAALSLLLVCAVIALYWFKMSVPSATLSLIAYLTVHPDTFRSLTEA